MSDQNENTQPDQGQSRDAAGGRAERTGRGDRSNDRSGGRHSGRRGRRGHSEQQRTARRGEASLNMDEVRELTELFTAHGLTDFEFENAEIHIRLSRNPAPQTVPQTSAGHQFQVQTESGEGTATARGATGASAATGPPTAEAEIAPAEPAEELHIITSPIVGTFYRSASPNTEPFVTTGSTVDPDTVVCIIEAMKLMNEILAETTGKVEKIYVENGQPVEYGQPLFGIKK